VELKRRKLQVKDEIERLRHNGQTSVHWPARSQAHFYAYAELGVFRVRL